MKKCSHCNAENNDKNLFCTSCGKSFEEQTNDEEKQAEVEKEELAKEEKVVSENKEETTEDNDTKKVDSEKNSVEKEEKIDSKKKTNGKEKKIDKKKESQSKKKKKSRKVWLSVIGIIALGLVALFFFKGKEPKLYSNFMGKSFYIQEQTDNKMKGYAFLGSCVAPVKFSADISKEKDKTVLKNLEFSEFDTINDTDAKEAKYVDKDIFKMVHMWDPLYVKSEYEKDVDELNDDAPSTIEIFSKGDVIEIKNTDKDVSSFLVKKIDKDKFLNIGQATSNNDIQKLNEGGSV